MSRLPASGRLGLAVMVGVTLIAIFADFIASDKPILARLDGELYLLPNLRAPAALRAHSVQSLLEDMGDADWLVPALSPWGINEQDKRTTPLAPPSARHWLGTDNARRDVLARLVHGTRVSLMVGVVSVLIFTSVGVLLGLLAGFLGGWVDVVISRLTETVMSIPVFFLLLALMGIVEGAGVLTLAVVIGAVYWTRVARLVRAETLRLRRLPFIEAAEGLGYSAPRIMVHHVLPNTLGPVWVTASFGISAAILAEAGLSFLGYGVPDSSASWGGLLRAAMGSFEAWWLVAFPGTALFVTIAATNLLGDALRDQLDPRHVTRGTKAIPGGQPVHRNNAPMM